jgi:hypothetical protein
MRLKQLLPTALATLIALGTAYAIAPLPSPKEAKVTQSRNPGDAAKPSAGTLGKQASPQVSLTFSTSPQKRGAEIIARITVTPGWEMTSDKPEDKFLYPCTLELKAAGLKIGSARWPKPHRKEIPELGFAKTYFTDTFEVRLPVSAVGAYDSSAVTGVLRYQSCQGGMCLSPDSLVVGVSR